MAAADVLIVGGGVIGASIAYHLAERGARVTVLERGRIGGHASLASAGLLHPIMEPEVTPALHDLTVASDALFPALVTRLRDLTGIDPQYQTSGWLRVALEPRQVAALEAQATERARHDHDLRMVSDAEARALEPGISSAVVAGLHLPRGAQVYVPALLSAYLHAAARLSGTVRLGVEVEALCLDGRRVVGVRTADGERILAGHTVLAGGAWTPRLSADLGLTLPVFPMRGQILALHAIPAPLSHVVFGPGIYLAPKVDGSVVVGATYEDAGFDDRLTAAGLSTLLADAIRTAPVLANATFREAWVGLRPASRDGLPILGPAPGWEGVSVATGHTAEGVSLSPITGVLMAAHIHGESPDPSLAPFRLERFVGLR
ncbi:MAG TPA: glycine oxidase ThiO [Chloroflexota bacterium]|nr:glycine oxidase ThiO [Chloroflexota bacterium]